MSGTDSPRSGGTFRALRHRDFRLFWLGQGVSVMGTWMQSLALSWLVYRLTDSPLALGLLSAARFGPSLIGSPLAGLISDRFPRRRVVLVTQALSALLAGTLSALTLSGRAQLWPLLVVACIQGIVDTIDMPARQTLQVDLVGVDDLPSAVALNAVAFNSGRLVGPAIAGVIVGAAGEGVCFAVNCASYVAVLLALLLVRAPSPRAASRGPIVVELAAGMRFAWSDPKIRHTLLLVAVTALFGLSYSTLLPVFARDVLHAGPTGYGVLLGGAGIGAIIGALLAASGRAGAGAGARLVAAQATLGLAFLAFATSRHLAFAAVCMVAMGLAVSLQLSTTNAFLQLAAPPELRGRVLALYIWLFVGASPIGGFSAGWVAERFGAEATAAGAAVACLAGAAAGAMTLRRARGAGST